MIVSDLLTASLRLIGVIASGETPATSEMADAFDALNVLVEAYNAGPEGLYKPVKQAFSVVGNTVTLSGAQRPQRILGANYTIAAGVMQPVKVVGGEEFGAAVFERIQAIFPRVLFCDYAFPAATVSLAPTPQIGGTLEITMLNPVIVQFASQSDNLTGILPPAYVKAFRYGLAVALAAEYGRPVTAEVAGISEQTRKALADLNSANYGIPAMPAAA